MSFIFETFKVPLWFLVFAFASAAPLWIKWYQLFYKKFIVTGILKKKIKKVGEVAEEKVDIFKKATDNWNASVEHDLEKDKLKKSKQKHEISSVDQPYVKIALKTLALQGDAGMLIQSLADKLEVNSNEIKSALVYLEKNEFVDKVPTNSGEKYYLSARGKKYCIKRGYIKG